MNHLLDIYYKSSEEILEGSLTQSCTRTLKKDLKPMQTAVLLTKGRFCMAMWTSILKGFIIPLSIH